MQRRPRRIRRFCAVPNSSAVDPTAQGDHFPGLAQPARRSARPHGRKAEGNASRQDAPPTGTYRVLTMCVGSGTGAAKNPERLDQQTPNCRFLLTFYAAFHRIGANSRHPQKVGQLCGPGSSFPSCSLSLLCSLQSSASRSTTRGIRAAGCAACGSCGFFVIFLVVAIVVLNVALLVWVARDAKARGMDSSVLWMLLVFFLSLLGLVIYLFSRPQGNLIPCPNCGNKRLQASVKCPHCGIGS